ncbi:MAG: DUF2314 domain-containing protein [Phycisphaerales bacterium]|nr:DUF2314 domain-containing protein [Phycisphaerales bacterium]
MKAKPLIAAVLAGLLLSPVACEKQGDQAIVQVSKDDPEMKAARDEALKRFPEFEAAFAKRTRNDAFAVKVGFPIRGSDEREYMWIDVRSMKSGVITGKLDDEPIGDVGLKSGEEVSANRADIHDWMYALNGAKPIGGFQVEVLRKIQKEGGR